MHATISKEQWLAFWHIAFLLFAFLFFSSLLVSSQFIYILYIYEKTRTNYARFFLHIFFFYWKLKHYLLKLNKEKERERERASEYDATILLLLLKYWNKFFNYFVTIKLKKRKITNWRNVDDDDDDGTIPWYMALLNSFRVLCSCC